MPASIPSAIDERRYRRALRIVGAVANAAEKRVISHVVWHGALLVTAAIVVGVAGAAILTRELSARATLNL
ncbi:MAG: hypothetical protein ACRD1Q_10195 [Vicinamibacterales bacterium]